MKYFFTYLLIISFSFGQSIQITVDKNEIEEGDIINLSIDASNSNDFPIVDFRLISNLFDVLSGPNQKTNIQYINGRLNSTKTLSWTLSPKNSGQVYIPPITGTIDGKNFKGKQILINVVKRKSIKSNSVFILADLDKNEAYIGEQVTLTYKLYKEMNVNIASIDQFQMPEFPGFWVEDLFNPQRLQYQKKIETINGMKYQVAILGQRALFPIPYKNYLIPPVQVKMQLEIQKKRRKRDPFFDPFFDSFFSESKTKLLISDKKKVTIKSYPKPKPKDFYGAVGDFKITSSVDLRKVKVNEGVTFKISLTGTGNLSLFSLPEIIFPEYVEVFKPNEVFEKDVFRNLLTGKKIWEYILIPRESGEIKLPEIEFSFFQIKTKTWKRIRAKPININVEQGKITTDNNINSKLTKQQIKFLDKDIRYIHKSDKKIESQKYDFKFFIYFLSFIIFLVPYFLNRFTNYRIITKSGRKSKYAKKKALKYLNNSSQDTFEKASNAFYSYLKDKLELSTGSLDPASVKSILEHKISVELLGKANNLLITCDKGRFSIDSKEKEPIIINEIKELIKQIEKELN